MACPLSSLLNARDISPIGTINRRVEPSSDLNVPSTPTNTPPDHTIPCADIPRYVALPINGYRYPVVLLNKRGTLYRRRAVTFSSRPQDLLTPPHSSPLLDSQLCDQSPIQRQHDLSFKANLNCNIEPPTPELDFRQFSIFNALHAHPEIVFELARHFDVDDLISLYAISIDFHKLVNRRFTTMIRNQAEARAPESTRIFAFRCYRHLCIRDPASRPLARIPHQTRFVPSFRWLRMVVYRERVADEIIACLASEGLFLPPTARLVIKKFWFTLDIGDTRRRIGMVHNSRFWTDNDLLVASLFVIKLDMRLTDPRTGNGQLGLRQMLLAQPSLTTLLLALQRRAVRSSLEMVRLFLRWRYRPPAHLAHLSILGVPSDQVGMLQYEGSGSRARRLAPVDSLIARETVRRQLNLESNLVDMILYGFVDKQTFLDRWHPGAVTDEEAELEQFLDGDGGGDGSSDGGFEGGGAATGDDETNGETNDEGENENQSLNDNGSANASENGYANEGSSSSNTATTGAATAAPAAAAVPPETNMDIDVDIDVNMNLEVDVDVDEEVTVEVDMDMDMDMEIQ